MKLFYSPASPYVRKVRVVAIEKGLADRIELLTTAPRDPATGLHERNPGARVPTLELDDGTILFDSPVICEYLDSLGGSPALFPPAGPARWTALVQQALGDGIMDYAVPLRHETMRTDSEQSAEFMGRARAAIHRSLDHLEQAVGSFADWDIGTIAIACALGYLDFRFGDDPWREGHPKLATWFEAVGQRPSMAETRPA